MIVNELQSLLTEICQKNGMPALAFDEDQMVTTPFGEGQILNLRFREDADDLTFVASLGEVPAEAQAAVLMELMKGNFNWSANGITFAWYEALNQPIAQYRLACEGLTADALNDALTRFLGTADDWSRHLRAFAAAVNVDDQEYGGGLEEMSFESGSSAAGLTNPDIIRG